MKKHNGIHPQDVVILLKIAALGNEPWFIHNLANELVISQSEVSESLHRSMLAGLLAADKKRLMKSSLLEFLHQFRKPAKKISDYLSYSPWQMPCA